MDECCVHRGMHRFENLWNWQRRRRSRHGRAGQGDSGADRAKIIRMLIRILAMRRLMLRGMDLRCRLHGKSVGVAEPKRKLNR